MKNKAVFLDRDGTIVEDVGYARSPEQMRLLPGAGEAIREFRRRGYLAVLITNQSGMGRGYFAESDLEAMHEKVRSDLAALGAALDAVYFCPHLPADHPRCGEPCECRKPRPGMLLRAAKELNVDLCRSYMIGDAASDVAAGKAAGCRTVLVASPDAERHTVGDHGADFVVHDLSEVLLHLDEET